MIVRHGERLVTQILIGSTIKQHNVSIQLSIRLWVGGILEDYHDSIFHKRDIYGGIIGVALAHG